MAKINLLPWRTERRRQRERDFYVMLGAAAAAAVLVWLLWGYVMGMRLDDQEARNSYLKAEIHKLDDALVEVKALEATRDNLKARKDIIEKLQAGRSQMVHLFDELVKTIPQGVRLVSLKQAGDVLTLQGVAQANGNVATYMRNLEDSRYLKSTDLQKTEVKGSDQRNRYEFGLAVKLQSPDAVDAASPDGSKRAPVPAPQPADSPAAPAPAGTSAPAPSPAGSPAAGGKP
jgi:type IV pilus assembly protein PilN